jgi:hypothetical protein
LRGFSFLMRVTVCLIGCGQSHHSSVDEWEQGRERFQEAAEPSHCHGHPPRIATRHPRQLLVSHQGRHKHSTDAKVHTSALRGRRVMPQARGTPAAARARRLSLALTACEGGSCGDVPASAAKVGCV